jgi:hypothetical protein
MKLRQVWADGNCLFRAATVAASEDAFYNMSPEVERETATKLRLDVVQFMSENEARFTPYIDLENQSFQDYIAQMKRVAWGGEPELCAIAEVKGCPVHVYVQKKGSFQLYQSYPTSRSQVSNEISLHFDFERRHYDALLRE